MKRPFDVHVFDGLQPTAYLVALYGILPVTIRSWVPGFNPRHSTLCYCVCVQAVVLWRIRQAIWKALLIFKYFLWFPWGLIDTVPSKCQIPDRFDSFSSVFLKRIGAEFGHIVRVVKKPRVGAWMLVLVSVMLPLQELSWMTFVEFSLADAANSPVHVYVNELLLVGMMVPALCSLSLHRLASALAQELAKELTCSHVMAQRVRTYRHAWIQLSSVINGLILTPISMCMVVGMVVVLITMHTYEALEKLMAGHLQVSLLAFLVGMPYVILMLTLCETSHRASKTVPNNTRNPKTRFPGCSKPFFRVVLHRFLETVWWNSDGTAVGGFFKLKRSSFVAVMAAVITYAFIMLQFHLSVLSPSALSD
ncbi:Gustatory receptor 21 [Frankliniella occidentalis]|nr:Gustatory receptor 21 [Frankliniella occidentalis]